MEVRRATVSDIDAAVGLAERTRRQQQKYQPTFWRKASDSAKSSKASFAALVDEAGTLFLIAAEGAQVLGFLIARKTDVPPIYTPGGDTWLVDEFHVAEPHHWLSVGEALLSHASTFVHEHGAAQIIVTAADRDLAKTEMLRRSDLSIATNWWTKSLK